VKSRIFSRELGWSL